MSGDGQPGDAARNSSKPAPDQTSFEEDTTQQQQPRSSRRRTHYPPRQCRICLDIVQPNFHVNEDSEQAASAGSEPNVTYESEEGGRLLSPCKCKGSQKFVHEDCLSAWRRADPTQTRNYWECPTCRYRYHLQRLTWSSWLRSTTSQVVLTFAILAITIFTLGFVADPIINLYIDPYDTIATAGGPRGSLVFDGEDASWSEHFVKGFASLGLLGCAKLLLSMSVWNIRVVPGLAGTGNGRHAGRDRVSQIGWAMVVIGIVTFLWGVWKAVRAWSRRTLDRASERVLDVPGSDDVDEDE